jgi:hypothetical protein
MAKRAEKKAMSWNSAVSRFYPVGRQEMDFHFDDTILAKITY